LTDRQTDRQTDGDMKLIVALRNFANSLKYQLVKVVRRMVVDYLHRIMHISTFGGEKNYFLNGHAGGRPQKEQCFEGFEWYEVMCATALFQARRDGWHSWTCS